MASLIEMVGRSRSESLNSSILVCTYKSRLVKLPSFRELPKNCRAPLNLEEKTVGLDHFVSNFR